MSKKYSTIKIYVPGGVLSPGDLRRIVTTAHHFGCDYIQFGNRQEIIFKVLSHYEEDIKIRFQTIQYYYTINDIEHHNIVTSNIVKNIFKSVNWLSEGLYLEIINSFDFIPKVKVSITDPMQGVVPLMSSRINFIASNYDNFWFLYHKSEKNELYVYPVLFHGTELAQLVKAIENYEKEYLFLTPQDLSFEILNLREWYVKTFDEGIKLEHKRFPNTEGFHSYGDKFWLGLFQREYYYSISFLDSLCIVCSQTNNNKIHISPWNGIIIKNIEEKDIDVWEKLLGKYKISTGHSSLELCWQLTEINEKAIDLKKYFVTAIEKEEIRTEGLTFGLKTSKEDPSTSIIIEKNYYFNWKYFKSLQYFTIYYRKDFNSRSLEKTLFADNVRKDDVPIFLRFLCQKYYSVLSSPLPVSNVQEENKGAKANNQETIYQCEECLTIFIPKPEGKLEILEEPTEEFKCSVCDSGKESLKKTMFNELIC